MPDTYADLEIRLLPKHDQRFRIDLTLDDDQELATGNVPADTLPWISSADPVDGGQRLFNWLFANKKLK